MDNPQAELDQIEPLFGAMPRADFPVALLPVRLETRFTTESGEPKLLVRIFPDELHIDTHEPELTEDELYWGQSMWEQVWRTGGNPELEKAVQDELIQRYGPGRAAWIAGVLQPQNPKAKPQTPVPEDVPLSPAPIFPTVPSRLESWTKASQTLALPDRWVVLGYRGGTRVLQSASEPIVGPLAAGPDPLIDPPTSFPDDQLLVDAGMRWLIDFETAVAQGMALRVPLKAEDTDLGFDRLIVLGLKTSVDGARAADELAKLLEAQHYTDNLAFVPQGTPSNNTADAPAGYVASEPETVTHLQTTLTPDTTAPATNATITAEALGISSTTFDRVQHADTQEQAHAQYANTALWPATWGYFLKHMMGGVVTDAEIAHGRRHFIDYVRARGPLPALRVGHQPYGLLPVTSLDHYTLRQDPAYTEGRLADFLLPLRERWRQAVGEVPRVQANRTPNQAARELANILSQQAHSVSYAIRPLGEQMALTLDNGQSASLFQPNSQQRQDRARQVFQYHGLQGDPRLLRVAFIDLLLPMAEALVQENPLSETSPLDTNYIASLYAVMSGETGYTYESLRDESFHEGETPNVLLYLLLRHAAMMASAHAAFRMLASEGLLTGPVDFYDTSLVDLLIGPDGDGAETTQTLDRFLDGIIPSLSDAPLRESLYMAPVIDHPEAAELRELRDSLQALATAPSAELDRLLRETLDLATYRFDAWITSLATKRLAELRQHRATGVILGGYGWVENLRPTSPPTPVTPPANENGSPLFAADPNSGFVHAPSLSHAATAAILRSGYLSHQAQGDQHPFAVNLSSDRVRLAQWLLDGVRQGQSLSALLGYRFERALHENDPALNLERHIETFRIIAPLGALYAAKAHMVAMQEEWEALERLQADELLAITNRQDALTTLINDVNAQLSQISGHQNSIVSNQSEITRLEGERDILDRLITALQNSLTFTNDRASVIQQIRETRAQIRAIDNDIQGHNNTIATLEGLIETSNNTIIQQLEDHIDLKQERLPLFTPILDDLQAEILDLQAQLLDDPDNSDLTTQLANTQSDRQLVEVDRQAVREQIPRLQAQIQTRQNNALDESVSQDLLAEQNEESTRLGDLQDQHRDETELADARKKRAEDAFEELLRAHRKSFTYPDTATLEAMEAIEATHVVDGLALMRKWQEELAGESNLDPNKGIPFGTKGLPEHDETDPEYNAIAAELNALIDTVDAISDLVTAESVHQLAQGNVLRAGATLDAIARGETPPPDLEVLRTPRSGSGLTHRIAVVLDDLPTAVAPWTANTPRAQAEPRLNAWAAQLLGDPSHIRCRAAYLDPDTGGETLRDVSLSELALSPLDVLYLAQGNGDALQGELEARLAYHLLRSRPANVPASANIRLTFDTAPQAVGLNFAEMLEVASATRDLMSNARALDASDLSHPEAAEVLGLDTTELSQRAATAVTAFQQAVNNLTALLAGDTSAVDLELVRAALVALASYGVQGAIPESAIGDTPSIRSQLLAQATRIIERVTEQIEVLQTAEADFDRATAAPEALRDHEQARLQTIFGEVFRVLPQFQLTNAAELASAFGDSLAVQDGDRLASVAWFQRAARVREGAGRLNTLLLYGETLQTGPGRSFTVWQLPYMANDRWAALPQTASHPLVDNRLSLVVHLPGGFDASTSMAGLLIDEWVEVTPSATEATGMAFHFDGPRTQAPQAILLAVPPANQPQWDLVTLEAILLETLELAQLRAVDPDVLAADMDHGHFLPALYVPYNPSDDMISTDLSRAAVREGE